MDADMTRRGPMLAERSPSAAVEGRGMRPDGTGDTGESMVVPPLRDPESSGDPSPVLRDEVPSSRREAPKSWDCTFCLSHPFIHISLLVDHLIEVHGEVR